MNLAFQSPAMFAWLAAVLIVALAGAIGRRHRDAALRQLGRVIDAHERRSNLLRRWGAVVALALLVVALARPTWRPRRDSLASGGRDVVFVLDVSRSMLARDRPPDRLASARLIISDFVERLSPSQRVGLVVYAGSALIVCPLTTDLAFFKQALDQAGPTSVAYGGTRTGDALRKTADKLLGGADRRGLQDVILFTDGGDQESEIPKAIEELNAKDASLLVIGLGSDTEGARIPEGDGFMVYRGREVWTLQESRGLEEIARAAKAGLYLNAGVRPVDLPDVYGRFTEHMRATRRMRSATDRRNEEFPLFLAAALLTFLSLATPWRPRLRRTAALAAAAALGGTAASGAIAPNGGNAESQPNYQQAAATYLAAARVARTPTVEAHNLYNAATCWLKAAAQIGAEGTQPDDAAKQSGHPGGAAGAQPDDEGMEDPTAERMALLEQSIRVYEAALDRTPDFPAAARNLEIARARWRQTTDAREQPKKGSDSPEEQPSDSQMKADAQTGEENQMNDESDESNADQSKSGDAKSQPSDTSLADLLNQNLPPPNLSPQDILRRELENNQLRSAPSDPKAKPVEKNW